MRLANCAATPMELKDSPTRPGGATPETKRISGTFGRPA